MPRAFLFTNKRYKPKNGGNDDFGLVNTHRATSHTMVNLKRSNRDSRDSSPERGVKTADEVLDETKGDILTGTSHHIQPATPKAAASLTRSFFKIQEAHTRTHTHREEVLPFLDTYERQQEEPLGLTVPKKDPKREEEKPVIPQESKRNFFTTDEAINLNTVMRYPVIQKIPCFEANKSNGSHIKRSPHDAEMNFNEDHFGLNFPITMNGSDSNEALALTIDSHICPECGKRYSTSSNLARHRQTHHTESDRKARKCPYCDKVYISMPAYSMHVRTHSEGCRCPFCHKTFSRPWLLQGHIRVHTGEKPFKCAICYKAFADKSNLRAHTQTHSTLKPYKCQRCSKAFALKSYLYKHEESSCMRMHKQQSRMQNNSAMQSSVTNISHGPNVRVLSVLQMAV